MTKTGPNPIADKEIELSCAVAMLQLDQATVQAVMESADRLGVPPNAQAVALWLLGSRAAVRYPGPIDSVLRFTAWLLSGRGSSI